MTYITALWSLCVLELPFVAVLLALVYRGRA